MNIYFAGSIHGVQHPDQQDTNETILAAIREEGHTVISEHSLVKQEAMADWTPAQVYAQDLMWITKSDALIAEVSGPSHGVGYEIAYAKGSGIPVLCVYREGARVSYMLLGNPDIRVASYTTKRHLREIVRDFLLTIHSHLAAVSE